MKLSEITPIQILGSVLVVNTVLAGGMTQLTDLFGATMANHILSVCILGSGICGGFIMNMGGLGSQARNVVAAGGSIEVGPNAKSSLATLAMDPAQNKIDAAPGAGAAVAAIAKAASVVLLAIMLSAMFVPSAFAAAKPAAPIAAAVPSKCALIFDPLKLCGVLTGNVQTDVQRVVARIAAVNKADLNYAMAKAKSAGTPASKIRLQCVQAISDASDQLNGVSLKNPDGTDMVRPDPALVTGIEDVAELIDNLSPQGVLLTSCAGAAKMLGMNALAAVNAIVTGTASFALLPAGL
jgi:hypothetical protein